MPRKTPRYRQSAAKIQAAWRRKMARKRKGSKKYPARFKGTSKSKYNFTKKVAKVIQQVAENKFKTNRYEGVIPKAFVHQATDGYQCSWNLGDAVSDYSGQGFPLASGLACLNVLPADRDGDYIFGKSLVSRIGIYMHPLDVTPGAPSDLSAQPKHLQFNMKVLKINAKFTPNGQQGSNVLSTQCWIDEANQTTGFADNRSFTQLDLKFYQTNKRRFNVLRNHNFMLTVPTITTEEVLETNPPNPGDFPTATATMNVPMKAYPSKKYFSIRTPINKKLYYDPAINTTRPPTNFNDSIYILITATAPNDTLTSQLANKWSVDTTNTFIYTDM